MFRTSGTILAVLLSANFLWAQTVSLNGTVTKTGGTAGIQGVKVALVKIPGLSATTDAQGAFTISGPVSVQWQTPQAARLHYSLAGNSLIISSLPLASPGRVEQYSSDGRKIASTPFRGTAAGKLSVGLPELGAGLSILRIITPGETVTRTIIRLGDALYFKNASSDIGAGREFTLMKQAAAAIVDTLIATKIGYSTRKVAIDAYTKTGITIPLDTASGPVVCTPVSLPASSGLTVANEKLPDPFKFYDGTKMKRKDQWECRRQEILDMASKYLYGPCPPKPEQVTGSVSGGSIKISCKVGTKSADFTASVGSGSSDVICLNLGSGIAPNGARSLSTDGSAAGKLQTLYGIPEIIPLLAQAWVIDRVMEVLELNPTSGLDPKKIMVTGCSGCGKGAYLVGAYSHIPLTVIVESGGKGVASLRMAEWYRHGAGKATWVCADDVPEGVDNPGDNGVCGPWFLAGAVSWLKTAPAKVKNLPFDQNDLLACIAPRACLSITNQNGKEEWCHLGGTCEALSAWAAEPVWNALGVPDNFGFLMYSEAKCPGHCSGPASARNLANEFFKRVFQGDTNAKTDVMVFGAGHQDLQQPQSEWKAMWVDWDMETTLE